MDTQPKHIMPPVVAFAGALTKNIPGPKVASSNLVFCQTISTKPKEEKQQILTFTKLKLANVWLFYFN